MLTTLDITLHNCILSRDKVENWLAKSARNDLNFGGRQNQLLVQTDIKFGINFKQNELFKVVKFEDRTGICSVSQKLHPHCFQTVGTTMFNSAQGPTKLQPR